MLPQNYRIKRNLSSSSQIRAAERLRFCFRELFGIHVQVYVERVSLLISYHYFLGLATFAPEKFAERGRLWSTGDPVYCGTSSAKGPPHSRGQASFNPHISPICVKI